MRHPCRQNRCEVDTCQNVIFEQMFACGSIMVKDSESELSGLGVQKTSVSERVLKGRRSTT